MKEMALLRKTCTRLVLAVLPAVYSFTTACGDSPFEPTPLPGRSATSASDENVQPAACFSTSPDPPAIDEGEALVLDAGCSTGVSTETTFSWQLGDGRTENGLEIRTRYRRAGTYFVELTVTNDEGSSTATKEITVRARPEACFTYEQVLGQEKFCTVIFDATCSEGDLTQYRWFFEGGQFPPLSLPDVNITTTEPWIEYSWAEDFECKAFRPFKRTVRLTVKNRLGVEDVQEQVVWFSVPFLRGEP
jgi:hypothetical protein